MAHFIATRPEPRGVYRFGSTQQKSAGARVALVRVHGFLKKMIRLLPISGQAVTANRFAAFAALATADHAPFAADGAPVMRTAMRARGSAAPSLPVIRRPNLPTAREVSSENHYMRGPGSEVAAPFRPRPRRTLLAESSARSGPLRAPGEALPQSIAPLNGWLTLSVPWVDHLQLSLRRRVSGDHRRSARCSPAAGLPPVRPAAKWRRIIQRWSGEKN